MISLHEVEIRALSKGIPFQNPIEFTGMMAETCLNLSQIEPWKLPV